VTIEQLEQLRAAIPEDSTLPLSTTHLELAVIRERRRVLDNRLSAARNATATLATLGEPDTAWLDHLKAWRKTLFDEQLAIPARVLTDQELGMRQNLTVSVRCIDFGPSVIAETGYDLTTLRLGALMREAGFEVVGADADRNYNGEMPWHGSLTEVEQRISDVSRRRAEAQARLDDALLDDDARATLEAEAQARRDALNAMPLRKTRGDGSQYDKYPDGRRVEVERVDVEVTTSGEGSPSVPVGGPA